MPTLFAAEPARLLVKPKAQLSAQDLSVRLASQGAFKVQELSGLSARLVLLSEDDADTALNAWRKDPAIEYAERDCLARAAYVCGDAALAGQEWHLTRIQAPQAWNVTAGRTNTVIAVLDSGINAAHPDFVNRLVPGYNFVANTADTSDDLGHGTAVSGVIIAAGNNNLGILGVAKGCLLLPVKVADANGFAYYSAIAQGVHYAVDHGARIINISIAGDSPSSTLQEAIDYAWSNNVVVVAAAGNNANDQPQYPAACAEVVAVSATQTNDTLADFSSFGTFITLAAPGDNIWTTQSDPLKPYGSWRGTSFSSPIVAATAGLAASINPLLSNTQIVNLLERTADDLGPAGFDAAFGYGRVNASRAVNAAYNLCFPPQPPRFAHVTLAWDAVPGRTYRVQYSTAPSLNIWTSLSPDILATSDKASRTDDLVTAGPRSYRVLRLP
jgi:subtilisin family serine protease